MKMIWGPNESRADRGGGGVKSWSMCRFPVVVHQGVVTDHRVVCSTHPAGREVKDPVWGTWPACVPSDRS